MSKKVPVYLNEQELKDIIRKRHENAVDMELTQSESYALTQRLEEILEQLQEPESVQRDDNGL